MQIKIRFPTHFTKEEGRGGGITIDASVKLLWDSNFEALLLLKFKMIKELLNYFF